VNEYITSSVQRLVMVIVALINCVLSDFDDMWLDCSNYNKNLRIA
jgi:hypothetical protein